LQYTSCFPIDYKGVDEDGVEGVDEGVQPMEEMTMKIPVAAVTGGDEGARRAAPTVGAASLPPYSSLDLVLVWRSFFSS
jgi:hypothetical protein